MPISWISFIADSFYYFVMVIVLFDIFKRSKVYPSSIAYYFFYYASYFIFLLLFNSVYFSSGGLPSNTHTVLMLFSRQWAILESMPMRWPVWFPCQSVGVLTFPPFMALLMHVYSGFWSETDISNWKRRLLIFSHYNLSQSSSESP